MKNLRLETILSIIPICDSYLDVGCDHGYLALELKRKYPNASIGASEVALGPLERAKETFEKANVDIPLYRSDGVLSIPQPYDCVIMAGMGAQTMISILEEGKEYFQKVSYVVLQANLEVPLLRRYLVSNGYSIVKETMVHDYKYYEILVITHGEMHLDELDAEFGPLQRRNPNVAFLTYWKERLAKNQEILDRLEEGQKKDSSLVRNNENIIKMFQEMES